ncbi:MAG TPA: hypothetical protein VHR40_04420 [Thermoleophilaceae bacterium]|jgi:hypothetical protein|nr:hypothetical protein [Thermoleophilaceae bacterium]
MNPITIRRSTASDASQLRRLAELDSARPLAGQALIAEHGGHPVAAVSLDDRRSIADPFLPTANVVEMLLKLAS